MRDTKSSRFDDKDYIYKFPFTCRFNVLLEEFNLSAAPSLKESPTLKYDAHNKKENKLYELITRQAIPLDELIEKSSMDVAQVSGILLNLQIRKLIKQLPGKQFVRNV